MDNPKIKHKTSSLASPIKQEIEWTNIAEKMWLETNNYKVHADMSSAVIFEKFALQLYKYSSDFFKKIYSESKHNVVPPTKPKINDEVMSSHNNLKSSSHIVGNSYDNNELKYTDKKPFAGGCPTATTCSRAQSGDLKDHQLKCSEIGDMSGLVDKLAQLINDYKKDDKTIGNEINKTSNSLKRLESLQYNAGLKNIVPAGIHERKNKGKYILTSKIRRWTFENIRKNINENGKYKIPNGSPYKGKTENYIPYREFIKLLVSRDEYHWLVKYFHDPTRKSLESLVPKFRNKKPKKGEVVPIKIGTISSTTNPSKPISAKSIDPIRTAIKENTAIGTQESNNTTHGNSEKIKIQKQTKATATIDYKDLFCRQLDQLSKPSVPYNKSGSIKS